MVREDAYSPFLLIAFALLFPADIIDKGLWLRLLIVCFLIGEFGHFGGRFRSIRPRIGSDTVHVDTFSPFFVTAFALFIPTGTI